MNKYGSVVQDERVLLQKMKISSEAYLLLMALLIISMLIKQLVYHAPFSAYATEFIGFFGASLYIILRNHKVGNRLFTEAPGSMRNKWIAISSMITGVTGAVLTVLIHHEAGATFSDRVFFAAISAVVTAVMCFATLMLMKKLNERRIRKLEQALCEDDEEVGSEK